MAGKRRREDRLALYETDTYKRLLGLVGENVRRVRTNLALSQEGLAERCDLAWRVISAVERGERNLTLVTIARLVDGLGVAPHELLQHAPPLRATKRPSVATKAKTARSGPRRGAGKQKR